MIALFSLNTNFSSTNRCIECLIFESHTYKFKILEVVCLVASTKANHF